MTVHWDLPRLRIELTNRVFFFLFYTLIKQSILTNQRADSFFFTIMDTKKLQSQQFSISERKWTFQNILVAKQLDQIFNLLTKLRDLSLSVHFFDKIFNNRYIYTWVLPRSPTWSLPSSWPDFSCCTRAATTTAGTWCSLWTAGTWCSRGTLGTWVRENISGKSALVFQR